MAIYFKYLVLKSVNIVLKSINTSQYSNLKKPRKTSKQSYYTKMNMIFEINYFQNEMLNFHIIRKVKLVNLDLILEGIKINIAV